MTLVMAHCPDKVVAGYAFAPVLAVIENGVLTPIPDAILFAPPRGTLFVPSDLIPNGFRFPEIGIWEVMEDLTFQESDDKGAKYRARRLEPLPLEIISIDLPSTATESIRAILCDEGLRSDFNIDGHQVCVEFSDGVVAGPIMFGPPDQARRVLCKPGHVAQPISAWKSIERLNPITFSLKSRYSQTQRRFAAKQTLPNPDEYLDLAPLEQSLRTLIRQVCKDGPGSFILTKNDQAALVTRLASLPLPKQLEARRRRLSTAIDAAMAAGGDIAGWLALVTEQPSIQALLEGRARSAEDEARRSQQAKVGGLKQEIASLTVQVGTLKTDIENLNKEKRNASDGIHDAIVQRAKEAVTDVEALLAQTALLRPFLSTSYRMDGLTAVERRESRDFTPLTPKEATKALVANFRICGLLPGDADFLAKSVLASAITNQFIRFSGSYADTLARIAAKSLGSPLIVEATIAPGLSGPSEMNKVFSELKSEENGGALIVLGSNVASLDLYGAAIREHIVKNSFAATPSKPYVLCFGTVGDGAASLSLTPGDVALGPVFNTDSFSWISPKTDSAMRLGKLVASDNDPVLQVDPAAQEEFFRALHAWDAPQPALWKRCVSRTFPVLQNLFDGDTAMVTAALAYGWLMPMARSLDVDAKEIEELAVRLAPGVLESAPALQRLVTWEGARS